MAISDSENEAVAPTADQVSRELRNSRYGLMLFVVYLSLYGGFMALNVIDPTAMKRPVIAGINLAIVYGFGLIVAALGLAIVYMSLCRNKGGEER